MALWAPGEAELQDKVCYPLERFQSTPQQLAAYYPPFSAYGHYRSALSSTEEDFQPLGRLEAAVSASQGLTPFPLPMASPLLTSDLALQREPLYDLTWYSKMSLWYPIPHLPREVPHFPSSQEYSSASNEDLVPVGGPSDSGQGCGPDTSIPPLPKEASLLSQGQKTSQLASRSPSRRFEDGPKQLDPEGKSPPPPCFHFTKEDLHFVLYGVTPSLEQPARFHYAISDLLIPADSSGSDHIPQVLDKDSIQLPEGLCIMQMMFGEIPHFGVFCSSFIAKGIRFGPFEGKVVNASELKTHGDNSRMWEVFEGGNLSHFIDGKGTGNWMTYVNCARFPKEQNLVVIQCQGQIFYESCKEIYQNQELLVWYGDCYEKFLDIPVSLQVTEQSKSLSNPSEDSCICSTCGKCFSQSSSLNKHMRVHSGDRPYQCVYCTKKFTASSILRTHIRQHSGEKPFKCKYCGKSFASHAAHDSHVRRSHKEDDGGSCLICGRTFPDSDALYCHMQFHENLSPSKWSSVRVEH
uniref:PR domain zinc finger protein 14 n=1 Tax=Ictidomys tridecemlineatus TaxID=43179 RepID=UPI001A9EDA4C|nr:PR domain zinc finger protein 14 [Ictidomys tridecemlineatus]